MPACSSGRHDSAAADSSSAPDGSGSGGTDGQAVIPVHQHEKTEKPVYDPDASCSIFIYMCGSNLESKYGLAGKDIDELLEADIPDQVNVVLETGGAAKWHAHGIANDKLQRYIVKDHTLILVEEHENASMGDVNTFVDFLHWGRSKYPAERNLFIIWDHGGDATKGVCYDENYGLKGLKQSDFRYLLKNDESENPFTNQKYDMVIFDTCFMGSIEMAAWLQDYAYYMIASEVIVPSGGLDYSVIAGEFAGHDDESFGKLVCDSFMEQCKAENQESSMELSLFDLSKTDAVLNEMEILFADNLNALNREDDIGVIEKSEFSDAYIYRLMADLYTTMENGTKNNVVDLYNYASFFFYSSDNWERLKTALDNLVLYQVGSVSVELVPDLDPGTYTDLCNGISLYFPLSFDRSALMEYIGVCPVEMYAQLLDTLYLQVPAVPMDFVDRGRLDENGQFEIQLTEDSADYLKEVTVKVWKQRSRDNTYLMIGTQTLDISENTDLIFSDTFNGEWYFLGGNRLYTEEVRRQNTSYLTAPIMLNGKSTEYHFSCTDDADGKPVIRKGLAGMQYDENGLVQRAEGFRPLKTGDIVETVSNDVYEAVRPFTLTSDEITAEKHMLEPGTYRLQFIAVDFSDQFISSDYALVEVSEDGVEALGTEKLE